jgi:hypothetical protein
MERPFLFPKSGAPIETDARFQSLTYISFGNGGKAARNLDLEPVSE